MTLERVIAKTFAMDDTAWCRHANPWSVILRNTALPLLILALWSRLWLGLYALIPVAISFLWIWLNPRIFSAPASFDSWASKAVLGERIWMNRDIVPVPPHHRLIPNILSAISATGLLFVFFGLLVFGIWPALFGILLIYCGKLWFLDRMVWLWEDSQNNPAIAELPPPCKKPGTHI